MKLWVLLCATGCLRGAGGFQCATDADCARSGAAGRCEAVHYCSFPDSTCVGGSRFGDLSGSYAGQCVTPMQIDDARIDSFDAALAAPVFVVEAHANANGVTDLTYTLDGPAGANRLLLVSVQIANNQCNPNPPNVVSVTYGGVALDRIATILGIGCSALSTRSEQWKLLAPPTNANDVVVTLDGAGDSVHSGAMVFTGVNQAAPIRAFATAANVTETFASSVDVQSAVGDLVVNTVGQGGIITSPDPPATQIFLNDVNGSNTLNNSAASYAPGLAGTTTMAWTFGSMDEWQTISSSLQPAP